MTTDFPSLVSAWLDLQAKNQAVAKVSRKLGIAAVRSDEYKAAREAHRLFFSLHGADNFAREQMIAVHSRTI